MTANHRLVLHLGTEKTGSSAIQRWLQLQRPWLASQEWAVPRALGEPEHWRFPLLFYDQDQADDLTARAGLDSLSAAEKLALRQRWCAALDAELQATPPSTWIISSEHLHSRLLHRPAAMQRLLAFVQQRFVACTALVYLREPLSAALSLWSTAVLNGAPLPELPLPSDPYWNRLCDHRATAEQLEHWFPGSVQLRLYVPGEWPDSDVVGDLCSALQLPTPPSTSQGAAAPVNASLSWLALALLARLNRRGQPSKQQVKRLREAFQHLPAPQALPQQRRLYAETYQASNAWVRQRYFPERATLF